MADARYLARTQDGQLYVTPWPQAILPDLSVSSQPSISGTIAPGQTLAAVSGAYLPAGLTRARWTWTLKNSLGVVVQTRNGGAYTIPSTAGSGTLTLTETMQATDGRTIDGVATATLTVVTGAPAFTVQPSIGSGGLSSVVVGTVLTANDGTVTGSPTPTKTRRWLRDGVAITSATGASYTTVSGDDGKTITLEVTASNGVGTAAVAVTAGIAVYAAVTKPVFTVQPTITRNATTGVFMANYTVTGGTSETRRYYSADTETGTLTGITGATWWEWTPPASYAGKWISYQVVATNEAGTTTSDWAPRVQIPAGEGFTAQPVVTPAAAADWYPSVTVATTDGTYRGAPTAKAYEWVVDGVLSTTLTASSFQLSNQSPGKKIKGRVKLTYASGNIVYSDFSTEVTVSNRPTTGDEGEADYTVTTAAGLRTALINASLGQIIECAGGDYGAVDLANIQKNNTVGDADLGKKSTYVWIRPADRSNPPHIKGAVALGNSSGIILDGFWVDRRDSTDGEAGTFKSEPYPDGAQVPATGNKGITFNKANNSGGNASNVNKYSGGRRIIVTNCLIQFAHRAVEIQSNGHADQPHSADLWFIGNEITECGMDAANIFRAVKRLRWEYNLIHRGHVATSGVTDTRHPDFLIQIDTFPAYPGDQNEDHTIMYNWCEAHVLTSSGGQPPDTHGTYVGHTVLRGVLDDDKKPTKWVSYPENISASNGHKNIRFVNNHVDVPDTNGISGQGFWGGEISRNKFLPWPRNGSKKPLVYMSLPKTNLGVTRTASQLYGNGFKVNDNTTYASKIIDGDGTSGATTSGNITGVTSEDTNPPGWVALSRSNSRQTSNAFKGPQTTPSGNCGRYRVGWSTFLA